MCRNIRPLHNFEPPATRDEVTAAALQYVRKVSGTTSRRPPTRRPSTARSARSRTSPSTCSTTWSPVPPPKNREVEAEKARARAALRYGRDHTARRASRGGRRPRRGCPRPARRPPARGPHRRRSLDRLRHPRLPRAGIPDADADDLPRSSSRARPPSSGTGRAATWAGAGCAAPTPNAGPPRPGTAGSRAADHPERRRPARGGGVAAAGGAARPNRRRRLPRLPYDVPAVGPPGPARRAQPGLRRAARRGAGPARRRRRARRHVVFGCPGATSAAACSSPTSCSSGRTSRAARVDRCYAAVDALGDDGGALLVAGSSLTVMSGFRFVRRAARAGTPVVIVNRGETRGDELATYKLEVGCSEFLTTLGARHRFRGSATCARRCDRPPRARSRRSPRRSRPGSPRPWRRR